MTKTNQQNNTNTTTGKSENTMTKNTPSTAANFDLDAVLDTLADRIAARLNGAAADKPATEQKPAKGKAAKAKDAEPEDEEEDEEGEDESEEQAERRAELTGMRITSLRKIAKDAGFDPDEVAGAEKADLIDAIIEDEFNGEESDEDEEEPEDEDEEETDEDEEEDEDDEEEDGEYDRDDLEAMSLKEVKEVAKESGIKVSEMKGLDQDEIIDLILGEDDEEEDEDEDEEEAYDEDDLKAMSLADLRALAKEWEVDVPKGAKKPAIIDLLLGE